MSQDSIPQPSLEDQVHGLQRSLQAIKNRCGPILDLCSELFVRFGRDANVDAISQLVLQIRLHSRYHEHTARPSAQETIERERAEQSEDPLDEAVRTARQMELTADFEITEGAPVGTNWQQIKQDSILIRVLIEKAIKEGELR